MVRIRRFLALLGLAAIVGLGVTSCSESEHAVLDFELVEAVVDSTGPYRIELESTDLDTFYQATRQSTSRIWVGWQTGTGWPVRAKSLLRFPIVLPADAVVIADTLRLIGDADGDYASELDEVLDQLVEVKQIVAHTPAWYDSSSVAWPFDDYIDLTTPATVTLGVINDTTTVDIPLPTDMVQTWVDDAEQNYGLALVPPGAGGFKRFIPSSTQLIVAYTVGEDTTRYRSSFPRSYHTTIFELDQDIALNRGTGRESVARVAGPHDFRGILSFDLATLPDGASINQLDLHLMLDPAATSRENTVNLGFHRLVSLPDEDLDERPAISFFVTALAETEFVTSTSEIIELVVDISHFSTKVQDGILIKQMNDYPSLVEFGFFTREAAAQYRPRLEVIYSLPVKPRL